jgi:glycosyltransferase involved in cell wall biosynthesis
MASVEKVASVAHERRVVTVPSLSIVVTTYAWPEALDAVLREFADQTDAAFDLVVADDGSGPTTTAVVDRWRDVFGDRLSHVWQQDDGFRLARVRNLGALAAEGDYLVFVDGDCIPRRRFVAAMRRAALPGWFLAGKRVDLSPRLSRAVLEDGLALGRRSAASLFRHRRDLHRWSDLTPRDRRRPWRPGLPEFYPHGNSYGFLMAMYRGDFEAVNGFDQRYVGWGEQDVDLAVRLRRLGLRCGWAGPHTTMLHLAHASNMPADRETWWLLQETQECERLEAVVGLRELRSELEESRPSMPTSDRSSSPAR